MNSNFPKIEELTAYQENAIRYKYPDFHKHILTCTGKSWIEKLYCYYHNITEIPTCKMCGNEVKFINMALGYRIYCSKKCCYEDPEIVNKRSITNLAKYGGRSPFASEKIKEKIKQTNLKKYGVENPNQNKEIHEKAEQTCLKKYGVTNPFASEEVKNKIKQTNLTKYGYENPNKNIKIREKIENTCLQRYGYKNPSSNKNIKQKRKETCLNEFGYEYSLQSPELRKKGEETSLKKYGKRFYTQTQEYQDRANKTKKEKHTFNSSKIEKQFIEWLKCNNINFEYQHKDIRYPFNCDFYFPDYDVYLEIQGWWGHGKHPFNSRSDYDKKILEKWKSNIKNSYKQAIETWTVKDPYKRKVAKKNCIELIEVFSPTLDKLMNIINERNNHYTQKY